MLLEWLCAFSCDQMSYFFTPLSLVYIGESWASQKVYSHCPWEIKEQRISLPAQEHHLWTFPWELLEAAEGLPLVPNKIVFIGQEEEAPRKSSAFYVPKLITQWDGWRNKKIHLFVRQLQKLGGQLLFWSLCQPFWPHALLGFPPRF